jgi:hypothetical protein
MNLSIKQKNVMDSREILNLILNLKNQELDDLDLHSYDHIVRKLSTFALYFYWPSGREHYRLLSKISTFFNNETIYDIGTNNGCSALALSENESNLVKSYDINFHDGVQFVVKKNISIYLKNVLEESSFPNDSRFIMLDTDHDGKFEKIFYNFLKENKYKGLLFLDDIHLNEDMKNFWESIIEEKYDLTSVGHNTGSGIVIFE